MADDVITERKRFAGPWYLTMDLDPQHYGGAGQTFEWAGCRVSKPIIVGGRWRANVS